MQPHQPTTRQSGFSIVEVSLIVLVAAVLAVISLMVYQRHKSSSVKSSAATDSSQSTGQPQSTTATQPAQTTTRYLTIGEWGVKMPLSESIKDAYYSVKDSGTSGGLPNTAWLGLKSLDATGCSAVQTDPTKYSPIGSILRALPTDRDPVQNTPYTQLYPNGVLIDGWYYAYAPWKSKSCAPTATLNSIDSAFATAAEHMVPETQYLTITEWGVRAPYSGNLKLSYVTSPEDKTVTFSSGQLNALSSDCTRRGGSIIRWAPTDQVSEGPPDANTPTAANFFAGKDPSTFPYAHIGNYYYMFAHVQSACGDPNTTFTLQQQTNDAVKALVPYLQAIPN